MISHVISLPNFRYFKQSKLTSFQRQVNLYGFRRLTAGPDRGAYYHEYFLRGRSDLLKTLVRIRIKGTGFKSASSPATEPDFSKFHPCLEAAHENHAAGTPAAAMEAPQSPKPSTESHSTVVTPPMKPLVAPSLVDFDNTKHLEVPDDFAMDPWTITVAPGPMKLRSIVHSLVTGPAADACPVTPEAKGHKIVSMDLLGADSAILSPIEDSPSPSPVPFYHSSYGQCDVHNKRDTFQEEIHALVNTDCAMIDDSYDPLLLLDEVTGVTC